MTLRYAQEARYTRLRFAVRWRIEREDNLARVRVGLRRTYPTWRRSLVAGLNGLALLAFEVAVWTPLLLLVLGMLYAAAAVEAVGAFAARRFR